MVVTGWILMWEKSTPTVVGPPVSITLPAELGRYIGHQVLFCQNEQCMKTFSDEQVGATRVCPVCGDKLNGISLSEKQGLPPDTVITRRYYRDPQGRTMTVSIVISGKEQKSIHRPQQCLPGQGHTIERSRALSVPLPDRTPLKVMLLDLRRTGRTLQGRPHGRLSGYAYWFVGQDKETPYHLERLFWMSKDRLLHNTASRWASVSVATSRTGEMDDSATRMSNFIAEFYPLILRNGHQRTEERSKAQQ